MKFFKPFFLLSRGKQIAIIVCAVHLFAIFCLLGHHLISSRLKPPRPMVVRTIAPTQNPHLAVAKKETPPPKQTPLPAAKPKSAPPVKKETPKPKPAAPVPKKEPAAKVKTAKPVVQKELPVDEEDLFLKEIGNRFEALREETKKTTRSALLLPPTIQRKPQVSETEVNADPTYSEFLIAYLQNALDLPEFGEVKAKIEIDRFGKLVDLEIVEAKSAKNAQFLKAELPKLDFPRQSETQVFTITFRNM